MDKAITRSRGFSLLEVMIAITLFAFFITAFLSGQGYNVSDSQLSEEQLMLQHLCEKRINELFLDPPKFSNATENLKETKAFEEKEYSNYEYTLELTKLKVPNFGQLFANQGNKKSEDEGDGEFGNNPNPQKNSDLEKLIFEELRKNIEKIIWQARVTVTNKETKYSYTLSTFLTNYNERVQLNVGI